MKILLNDAELDALTGLPYVVICCYVMAIRPRMDYVTGRVGVSPFISWQALAEWLYVEPHQGIKSGSPYRSAVRRMADQLVRAGLVKIQSNIANAQLIFELPKATRYSYVQNKADTKPTPEADRGLQRGKHTNADRGKKAKADTHLSTPVPTNKHHHNNNVIQRGALIWPDGLTSIENRALQALIGKSKLNGNAQLILDELAGAMRSRAVSNKVGYARTLIERAERGEFTPEKAHITAAARERQAAHATTWAASEARALEVTPAEKAKGAAILKKIRDKNERKKRDSKN